jgi:hypothetical protein
MQLLAILGYRTASYLETTLCQYSDELFICERGCLILSVHQLLNQVMHLLYRNLFAIGIGNTFAKKIA